MNVLSVEQAGAESLESKDKSDKTYYEDIFALSLGVMAAP